FHDSFLAATQGWSVAEIGAYFLLLGAQWEMGPLPTDMAELAAIAHMTVKDFKVLWRKKISGKFNLHQDRLANARLEGHRRKALELLLQHRQGAQRTNTKRWGPRPSAVVVPISRRSLSDTHGESPSDTLSESLSVSPISTSSSSSSQRLTREGTSIQSEDLEGERLDLDGVGKAAS
ncbi:MAG: DUF1376 domain-containing protein, partial [Bryobacteraceae bacterium]